MIDDFILGLAIAIFGGVLALMGLPSRFRSRLPSLPVQQVNKTSRAVRTVLSLLALVIGLPIAFTGLGSSGRRHDCVALDDALVIVRTLGCLLAPRACTTILRRDFPERTELVT